ncbi:MAG: DNRLRE domain-containing protein, partial [Candidatus Dojkabacteria bacterium]|nr:DNRLRE domain-containing protein [Candidatus Dojkabacteria bacterium]
MRKASIFAVFVTIVIITVILAFYNIDRVEVSASTKLSLLPIADAMVREDYPDRNYGVWNDMTIGRSWNLGNYFSNSFAYVKFDLSSLNSQTVIESAYLDLFQYVRSDYASGDYVVKVARANGNWSENSITWGNKPSFSGAYSSISVGGYGGQWFNPPLKYTFDVTELVQQWVGNGSNQGLVLYKDGGNYGGFWCSRNYNNSTCFATTQPRLTITFGQNHAPYTPRPTSPLNMISFGGDSSTQGAEVTMKVTDLGDPDGNLEGTWFYYKRVQDADWEVSPIRTGKQTAQFTKFLPDGNWEWKARSQDDMTLWGAYSTTFTFTIDTTSPEYPIMVSEPEFSVGHENEVMIVRCSDELSRNVYYELDVASGEDCNTPNQGLGWQQSRVFLVTNLDDDTLYCFKGRAKDEFGNTTGWSESIQTRQDSTYPKIKNVVLDQEVFSPNDDGVRDSINLSFDIDEKYFKDWSVQVIDLEGEVVRTVIGTTAGASFQWNGSDFDGKILADGPYRLLLKASDVAGNTSEDSSLTVTIDNQPSVLNISQPKNGTWTNSDKIKISGIAESSATVRVNGNKYSVDENGVFEGYEIIDIGENDFTIEARDIAGNFDSKTIIVNKELDKPNAYYIGPSGVISNKQPIVEFSLSDKLTDFQSGLDADTFELNIVFPGGDSLPLMVA